MRVPQFIAEQGGDRFILAFARGRREGRVGARPAFLRRRFQRYDLALEEVRLMKAKGMSAGLLA